MSKLNQQNSKCIAIPFSDPEELRQYQRGIINLLSKVEIDDCNAGVRDDIKSLYKLLSFLMNDPDSSPKDLNVKGTLIKQSIPEMS